MDISRLSMDPLRFTNSPGSNDVVSGQKFHAFVRTKTVYVAEFVVDGCLTESHNSSICKLK